MIYYTNGVEIVCVESHAQLVRYFDASKFSLMSNDEVERHEHPERFYTEEQIKQLEREQMPDLSPIQFEWKLDKVGLLTTIKNYVETTENTLIKIAYNRAIYFKRTDPILIQAMTDLGLTAEQVDHIWLNA